MGEGDSHAEGASIGAFSHMVEEELFAPVICQRALSLYQHNYLPIHNLLVVVQLIASHTGAGLLDAARIVIPL
jgi:hypothetical protein